MNSKRLLQELENMTKQNVVFANDLKTLPKNILIFKERSDQWNILECLDHLNQYSDYYLPKIFQAISISKNDFKEVFHPGTLGNYFAKSMLPKDGMKKLKSPKDKLPSIENGSNFIIENFIENQKITLSILEKCRDKNLNRNKVSTSISRFIQLKLGDVLRFVVYHNLRHVSQANKIMQNT